MNMPEAKITVASYLTGRNCITDSQLKEACDVLNEDKEYLLYLKREFGLMNDFGGDCEVFLANLAEFVSM